MSLTTFRYNAILFTSKYAPACVCASLPQGSESGKSFAPGAFCIMENEVWLPIRGYEGQYEISNIGRVKSLDRIRIFGGRKGRLKGRFMKLSISPRGYYTVDFCKDGVHRKHLVHRLVAASFIPNPNDYLVVNHLDCDQLNNSVENLEWCSQSRNINYAYQLGRKQRGESHHLSTLKESEVLEIRKMKADTNLSLVKIAKIFNVSRYVVGSIILRKTWKHIR